MKKFLAVLVVLIIISQLIRCGRIEELDGKYISKDDKKVYYEFDTDYNVTYCENGKSITGTYLIDSDEKTVGLYFSQGKDSADDKMVILRIKNKNKLIGFLSTDQYIKRTFKNYYWKRIIVLLIILGVIQQLYDKVVHKEHKEGKEDFYKER